MFDTCAEGPKTKLVIVVNIYMRLNKANRGESIYSSSENFTFCETLWGNGRINLNKHLKTRIEKVEVIPNLSLKEKIQGRND